MALIASYVYAKHKQKIEYQKWLIESRQHNGNQNSILNTIKHTHLNKDKINDTYNNHSTESSTNKDANDQLNIGTDKNKDIDTSDTKFISEINLSDASALFINNYYKNIVTGKLEQVYNMSKQTVSFNTFKNWYSKTSKITLDKLARINSQKSSIELTLYEGTTFTRYGVLMTLLLKNETPVKIKDSKVKILAQGKIENRTASVDENSLSQEYNFFIKNKNTNILTTNQEFENVINNQQNNYIILDAREDIEYENGHFPNSLHIRFADLKAGRWIELPKNKFIYVFCWSGIRGKEVAKFLRTKKIVSSYLENGANGWVNSGGKWDGSIKFSEKYTSSKYRLVFKTKDVKKKVQNGAILIDSREPYKFNQSHIKGSINIPIMYTPTINLNEAFNQIPPNSKIITVCDGYVNCFDAKITGVESEKRGHQFLGRYNKPWEYEK